MSETPRTSTGDWKWRRREAIIRDDYTCQECGAVGGPRGDASLEVHHMTPVAEGGSDDLSNLETLCADCHHTDRENPGWFDKKWPDEDFLAAIRDQDLPTTTDVAEAVGCNRRTAYVRLTDLEDAGRVSSRTAGRAKLWAVADGAGE